MGELWAGRFQVSEKRSSLTEPIRNQNDPKLPQEVASISSLGVCNQELDNRLAREDMEGISKQLGGHPGQTAHACFIVHHQA